MIWSDECVLYWRYAVAISLADEQVISLAEATRLLPRQVNGKKVHVSTLHRWCSRGLRGVRLESLKLGGRVVTSVEALQRFAERCSSVGPEHRSSPNKQSQQAFERAETELEDAGI